MSNTNRHTSNNTPDFYVLTPTDRGRNRKPFWFRIGSAWAGEGDEINIRLNGLPLSDVLILRKPTPKDAESDAAGEAEQPGS